MKKSLIDKYLNGETSHTEERDLLHRLRATPPTSLIGEERAILTMLSYRDTAQEEDIFEIDLAEEYDCIVRRRKRLTWMKYTGIAASVAIIAIVGTIGIFRSIIHADNMAVAYVYGTETTDEELVMSMMKSTMSEMLSCSTTNEKLYELFNPE